MYGPNNDPYRNNQQGYGQPPAQPQQSYQHDPHQGQYQHPQQNYPAYGPVPQPYGQAAYAAGGYEEAIAGAGYYEGDLSNPAVLAFAKKVYLYFASALGFAALAAFGSTHIAGHLIATEQMDAVIGLWVGSLIVFFVSYFVVVLSRKSHSPLKTGLLYVFAGAAGFTLAPILALYVGAGMGMAIVAAFGIATVIFLGATVYVLSTGKDFRSIGGILFIALLMLIGLILMSWLIPFPSLMVQLILFGGMVLFTAFTLYDTSRVVRDHFYANDAVSPAIMLLFNFIMLFRYALLLLGRD